MKKVPLLLTLFLLVSQVPLFALDGDPRPGLNQQLSLVQSSINTKKSQLEEIANQAAKDKNDAVAWKNIADANAAKISALQSKMSEVNADTQLTSFDRQRLVSKIQSSITQLRIDEAGTKAATRESQAKMGEFRIQQLRSEIAALEKQEAEINAKIGSVRWLCRHAQEEHLGPANCAHPEKGGQWIFNR